MDFSLGLGISRGYVIEGDSQSDDSGQTSYGTVYKTTLANPPISFYQINALSGSNFSTMNARWATTSALYPWGRKSIFSFLIGANETDFSSPSSYAASLATYADRARALPALVVMITIMGQNDGSFDPWRNSVNTIIRGWGVGLHYDGLVDFAADPIMGPDNSSVVNPTYWSNTKHPSQLGQNYLATLLAPVINGLPTY